jgi:preprotein translocase subunit SecB
MPSAAESSFRFLDYRLDNLVYERNPEEDEYRGQEFSVEFSTTPLYWDLEQEEQIESPAEGDNIRASITLALEIHWEAESEPFDFSLILTGLFEPSDEMENFEKFSEVQGPAVLFTHARPIVSHIMREAEEDFMLPLLNIARTIKETSDQE